MTPPNIYLDQDALINLFELYAQSSTFKPSFDQAYSSGRFRIVLSPWHWVETARTSNLLKAIPLAEFMDGLGPGWLRDRRHLEDTEVEQKFFRFANVPYLPKAPIVTRADLLTEMNGFAVAPEQAPSSAEFVEGWIKKPRLMEPILNSYRKNAQALISLRQALARGQVTPAMMKDGDRRHIERHLPKVTPNGILIDSGTKNAFLDQVTQTDFPTLAIESEIAEFSWANQGRTDWNSLIDKFHLIASTPYTDYVVSDDRFFYLLLPSAQKTGYVRADVMRFNQFLAKFVP